MFWRQTPRLFACVMRGRSQSLERAQRGRAWLAWHTAIIGKLSRPPSLSDLLGDAPVVRAQTPAEVKSIFATMREAAGLIETARSEA